MPSLIFAFKWKANIKEVIIHALECIFVFVSSELTKKDAIKLAVSCNITGNLATLKDIY